MGKGSVLRAELQAASCSAGADSPGGTAPPPVLVIRCGYATTSTKNAFKLCYTPLTLFREAVEKCVVLRAIGAKPQHSRVIRVDFAPRVRLRAQALAID